MSRLSMKDGRIVLDEQNEKPKNTTQKTSASNSRLSMVDGRIVLADKPAANAANNQQYLQKTRAAQQQYQAMDDVLPQRRTNVMDMAIDSLRNRVANSTIGRAANEWTSRVSGNIQNVLNESPEYRAAKRQARAENEARRQQFAIDTANLIDQASAQYEGPTRTETVRGKFTDTEGADMFSNDWEPGAEKEIEYTRTVRNENYNPLSREDRDALISRYADAMNGNTDANGYQQVLYDVTKNGGIEQLYREQQADAANDREYGRQLRGVDLDSMNFWQRLGGTLGGTVAGAGEQIASSGVGLAVSGLNREAGIATQEFGPALEQTARRWFYALANGAEDDPAVEEQIRTLASYVGVDADTLVSRVKDRAEQARNSDEDQAVFAYGLLDGLEADQDKIWENAQQAIADAGFYDTINNLQQKSAEHIQYAKDVNLIQNQFGDNLVEAGVSTIQNAADAAMAATLGLSGTGVIAMIPFALRAYGGTYAEQMQQATELGGLIGQDVAKRAAKTAGLSSAIEVGTELMWGMVGAMSKVTGGGALDDAAQQRLTEILSGWAKTETGRKILTTVGEKALGGITEGLEEVIGDAAEQILKNAGIMPGEAEEWSDWVKNAGHSFVTGALGGLLGEVTSVVSSPLQKSQIGKQLKAGGLDISLNELADLANSEGMENTTLARVYNDTFSGMPRNIESISDLEAGKLYEAYEEMLGKRTEAIDRIEQMQAKVEAGETLTRADVNRITNNSDAVSILAESGSVNEDAFSGGINERRDAVEMALRAFANDSTALSEAQAENVQAETENANTAVSAPNPFLTMSNSAIDNIVRNAQPMSPAQSIRESNTSNMLAGNVLRSAARVVDAAERLNVSERGQDVMARMYSPNMDAIDYVGEMTKYYNQGKEGKTFDVGSIEGVSAIQAQAAFNAGRQEYIERSNNGEEGLRVRTSSERQNGQSAGGPVGVLEESTGAAQGRQIRSFQREGSNARVSAESLRTEGAKAIERSGLRIVTNDSSVASAKKYAEDRGVNFVAYAGGALNIDGVQSRGYYDSDTNTVYVRADHRLFTAEQIAKHETTHAQIHNGKITLGEVDRETVDFATVRDALVKELTQERFDEMVDAYVEMYAGTNLSRQDVFEELICDSVAGMNDFVSVGHLEEAVKFAPSMSKAKAVAEAQEANGTRAGPTEGSGKYSAETKREYPIITVTSNDELAKLLASDPRGATTVIGEYIFNKYAGEAFTMSDGRKAIMDKADARKMANDHREDRKAIFGNLRNVIEQAEYDHDETVTHNKFDRFYYYGIDIKFGEDTLGVWVNVGHGKFDGENHIYTLTNRESRSARPVGTSLPGTTLSATNVAEENGAVNKNLEKVETAYDKKTESIAPTGDFSRDLDSYLMEHHKEYENDETNRKIAAEGVQDLINGAARISAAGGEVDMAKQRRDIRTLGNGISAQFVKTGRVNLNGTRIRSAEDLAQVGQIFRNPKFETLRYLYVKKGKIVGTDSVTAMLPGRSPALSKDFQEADLIKKIARTGADGVYLLHNHPSGDVTPSRQDFGVTGKLAETIQNNTKAKFMGHVVIDHETYAQIDVDTNKRTASWEQKTIPGQSSFDFLLAPSLDNENLGKEVLNAGAVAAVGKEVVNSSGYSAIIYASSKGYVRQLQEVSDKALKNNKQIGNYIRNQRVNSGAGMAFVYTKDRDVYDALVQVYGDDILTDVVLDGAEFKDMRKNVFQREGMYMGVKEGEIGGVHANEETAKFSRDLDAESNFNALYTTLEDGRIKPNNVEDLSTEDWKLIYKAVNKLGYGLESAKQAKEVYSRYVGQGGFNKEQSEAIKKAYGVTADGGVAANPKREALARKTFGTTGDFREAGYLMRNGSMLDFSGKKDGGPAHVRYMDHREIGSVFGENEIPEDKRRYGDNSAYMNAFISEGNIRLMDGQGVTIGEMEPTPQQYKILKQFIERVLKNEDYFYLDLSNNDGYTVASRDYEGSDGADKIIREIKAYYKNGELPYRSSLHSFFSRDLDTQYMAAAERGDTTVAQRMVDEAAKEAGYDMHLYHGAKNGGGFNKFKDWSYFTDNKYYAEKYQQRGNPDSVYDVYVKSGRIFDTRNSKDRTIFEKYKREYGLSNLQQSGLPDWTDGYDIVEFIEANGLDYDGVILDEGQQFFPQADNYEDKFARVFSYVIRESKQVKSADPITYDDDGNIIPLEERFNPKNDDIRFSRDLDADYMKAVESGDTETAAKLVKQAANEAGYTVKAYHIGERGINVFQSGNMAGTIYFADSPIEAKKAARTKREEYAAYLRIVNPVNDKSSPLNWYDAEDNLIVAKWKREGHDAVYVKDEAGVSTAVFYPEQIKSAETFVYDDKGDIIPLSERFNQENRDIRYSRDLTNTELYEANRQLQKDVTELRQQLKTKTEQYKYWKGQTKVTEGRQLRTDDVTRLAREIIKGQESSADAKAVAERMKALGEYILNATDENVYDEARLKAYEIAHEILSNAKVLNEQGGEHFYKDFRAALKQTPIYVAPSVREEVAPDGWNDFRKAQFGTVNMTADQNKGKSVDVVYHDLQSTFGEWLLPEYVTSEADQLNKILEVVETYRPIYENLNSYEMADAVEWTANEILTRIIGEEIRETNPTYADRMEKKLADQKAKAQTALKQVRQQRDRKVADLKAHYQQVAEDRRNRRIDSEMRSRLLKIAERLNNKKLDRVTRGLLDQYIGELDLVSKGILGRTVKELETLQAWYDSYKESMGDDFIPDKFIERKIARLSKKHISDLTQEEVADLTTVLLNLETMIRTQNQLIESQIKMDAYAAGVQTIDDINNSNGRTGFLNKYISTETATPEREIHRITGYRDSSPLYKAAKELSDGQRKMLDYQMRAEALFKKWTTEKKFIRRIAGKNAEEITVSGYVNGQLTDVKITPAMRMALYLHEKNDDNMRHISKGGVKIPDMALYKKGKLQEAYDKATRVVFTRGMLKEIASKMSADEKAFADAVDRYYNGMSRNEINDTSEALRGYAIAGVEHYYPIDTDGSFLKKEFDAIKRDGSIEGMGILKERIEGATNPIMLYDMNDTLNRSISQHSKYVGLAIPVRNFNKLYGVTTHNYETSVAETLKKNWGSAATSYIEKMMADVQNGTGLKSDACGDLLARARSHYAGAVLNTNASVAMKQAASYPTAAAVVGYGPLMRALADVKKIDLDKLAQYTPLLWYRSKGFSTTELGDIGKEGGHIPKALNWIQAIDVATTTKLAKAAMYYVNENNLTRGTDAWWKAVAEVYNRIIEETQPNYTMMQRPQILRSDNALTRALNMFKTQPFQNFNILYDAFGNLAAKSRENKANPTEESRQALKSARTNAVRAVTSQAVSAFIFALMQFAWDAFRGKTKKYRDKDDEMTLASWMKGMGINVLSSVGGMIPFGSYALELAEALTDAVLKGLKKDPVFDQTFYGLSENAAESMNDMGNALLNIVNKTSKALQGESTTETTIRSLVDSMGDIAQFAGIPLNNVIKLAQSIGRNIFLATEGKYVGGYYALRVTTDPSKYKSDYYDLLWKAYNNDKAAYNEIIQMMLDDGFEESKIKDAMEERMKDAQGVSHVDDLDSRWMAPAQQKIYDEGLADIENTTMFQAATDEQQKKVLTKLYNIALENANGKTLDEKIEGGADVGLDQTEYLLYSLALSMTNPEGGTPTNGEVEAAILMVPGLSKEERAYLWDAAGKAAKSNPWR